MTKYRVYGDKTHKYYIDVEASSEDEAWDLALQMNSIWHDVETDDAIEPYSVEEYN
jgi:hypothetical protein